MEEKQQDSQTPVTPWNLAIYYRRLFPSHIYCKWLAYGERELDHKSASSVCLN
jgi:hypothetical protein